MKPEYEATFLAIDIEAIRAELTALGAIKTFPQTSLTRTIFDGDALPTGAWVRLRDEAPKQH
ncbi:hypothetical protein OG308_30425 [Nocardia salmonicida]|uniref:Uncharacterized protein n=1 Tax=Nocardia salmonicida TaxID=53431 RepID=A0ABZ1N6Q6_9NOCA